MREFSRDSRTPGQPLEIAIHDLAFGGKGVGRAAEGMAVFVPWVIDGERVRVRVRRRRKNFAEAELLEILEPSPHRVEPRCVYFGQCGGCAYQHIDYAHQLEIKSRQVEETLRRVGKFTEVPMRPMIASPRPYEYRNRIRVHVAEGAVGFFAARSAELVDVDFCPIAQPRVNEELREIRRARMADGDYSLRARRSGVYFEQTNDEVAALLVARVAELVGAPGELLIDAFCGAGLFARQFAPAWPQVIGIEENASAIDEARARALPNERYLVGDVGDLLPELLREHAAEGITLLLDPPAGGLSVRLAEAITLTPPARLIYVSCDPATLARDLRLLGPGFALRSVTPVDMFPQTAEIEVIAELGRAS